MTAPLWVKICANTSLADAQLAVDAGADAVGFVFAPSPRHVTAAQVAAITPYLDAGIEKIGVFVDAGVDEILATVRLCRLTGAQLHSDCDQDVLTQLRQHHGPGFRILRVVHFREDAQQQAAALAKHPLVDAILIDSRTATAVGGTGKTFDWAEASNTVFHSNHARLVAAGGLNPANVAEAIAVLHPWGVDVASGVETEPGRKDPAKVRAFVANARAAAQVQPSRGQ